MNTCYIFGALPVTSLPKIPEQGDLVIAADKGIETIQKFGLHADCVIGDFDSLGYTPKHDHVIPLNVRKDDTDTGHALDYAFELGYRSFIVYGAVGGLLDHTVANIQLAASYAEQQCKVLFFGEQESFLVLHNTSASFPAVADGRISVFSLSGSSEGVSIEGLSYPVSRIPLSNLFPLGVSNEFVGLPSKITVEKGKLLIIWSHPGIVPEIQ